MSRQKVILFIVEGTTDEDALSGILKKLFQNNLIRFAKEYIGLKFNNYLIRKSRV